MSKATNVEPEEDFLTEDPEISSQKFVLLSFLSPEKILKSKDLFFFQKFLNDYALQWRTSRLEAWLAEQVNGLNAKMETLAGNLDKKDLSGAAVDVRSNLLRVDTLIEEFQQYTRKNTREVSESTLKDDYETFVFKNGAKLEDEFFSANQFRTTIRGIKVRGVFSSDVEASARARRLQKSDPNFNIYMGAVGKWMAWEPEPNTVADQEYANDQLNTLMKKYRENEENREVFYNEQKKSRVGTAKTNQPKEETTIKEAENDTSKQSQLDGRNADAATSPFTSGASDAGGYAGLFSESVDLAIQRKMEREAEKDE
jgi:hypothetical protein